ncbi:MAG: alpha/beta hydrolase [Muribaculaceae bacterium]|nr:alpha/beta hydrolase [Muribaculaceae bacterium]MDE6196709.1 alpha/beta hydrolase [Muribaculaceae bacterium]
MEKTIEIDGVNMRYDIEGCGQQPVIVMHGWGCKASTVAVLAQAAAGSATTVYNLDLPGFGASTEPADVWGVDRYTQFIEEFCRRLGIADPVLIGHSFGGRIAIMFASRNKTSKVILVDAAGIKPRRPLRYYVKVYTFKAAKKILPLLLGKSRGNEAIDRMRGKAGSSDYRQASPKMRAIMSRVVNEDLTGLLPSIKAPALLIWGEKDTATPMRDARIMERLIPDAGLVSYPEAGHYSFLDRPAQTAAVIKSFLKPE